MRKVLGALCVALLTVVMVSTAVLLGVGTAAPAAAASPTLLSSSPPANASLTSWPDAVTLTFSKPVAKGTALLRVDGPGGAISSTGRTSTEGRTVSQPLAGRPGPGEYVLRWTVVLSDGSQLAGTLPFTYGTGAKPDTPDRIFVAAANSFAVAGSHPAVAAVLVGVVLIALGWGLKRLISSLRG